jgi:hypothetical protein
MQVPDGIAAERPYTVGASQVAGSRCSTPGTAVPDAPANALDEAGWWLQGLKRAGSPGKSDVLHEFPALAEDIRAEIARESLHWVRPHFGSGPRPVLRTVPAMLAEGHDRPTNADAASQTLKRHFSFAAQNSFEQWHIFGGPLRGYNGNAAGVSVAVGSDDTQSDTVLLVKILACSNFAAIRPTTRASRRAFWCEIANNEVARILA